ncbi:cation transporter [Curtobacterium sp. TC1]|uniref:cation transporter n=1 Tax=Curtobacterium sp. TC1 TaxID=2862880 RepID=UPI0021BEAEBC|nr:cation transporter [Curtobacterium sp. TC1]
MLLFGAIGPAGNIVSILVLAPRRNANLNLRAAFLDVVTDVLGSADMIPAAIVIAVMGWSGVDAIAVILIAVLMLPRTFALLRDAVDVLLNPPPPPSTSTSTSTTSA